MRFGHRRGLRDTVLRARFNRRIEFMRTLVSFLLSLFLMATSAAQSPSPTPPPSSTPTPEDRPTLNRPGSSHTGPSNTGLGPPSPTPTPHSLPAAPAKGEENAEPPQPSY